MSILNPPHMTRALQPERATPTSIGKTAPEQRPGWEVPIVVPLRVLPVAAAAQLVTAVGALALDSGAGGLQGKLEFVALFGCVCIAIWFGLVGLTTAVSWLTTQGHVSSRRGPPHPRGGE